MAYRDRSVGVVHAELEVESQMVVTACREPLGMAGPSRRARVFRLAASEPASGSVKQ